MAKKPCKKQIKQGIESLCICQTVNLSKETLAVSDVSRVWENLFRSSGSPGFQVPNSELPEPLGTTQNGWEATLPKVIPACVQPLHTTASHVPFTLLPVKLSSSLFLAHIYTSSTQSFPSVILPPSGSWLKYVFILTVWSPYLLY